MNSNNDILDIAIIGGGIAGICLSINLRNAGFKHFKVFEKTSDIGGTWRENTYPGCACDIRSMAFCFSFEQKTDWSAKWSPQSEMLEYLDHCVSKYGLHEHLLFNVEVISAEFNEDKGLWHVNLSNGKKYVARNLVSCVGQLSRPAYPQIEGLDQFSGEHFHSAKWNHNYDLNGKKVAVIGNAASAIQFVPEIAPKVDQLQIFQRSANWIIARGNRKYRKIEKQLYRYIPGLARIYRWCYWIYQELLFPAFRGQGLTSSRLVKMAKDELHSVITDPELRQQLLPDDKEAV